LSRNALLIKFVTAIRMLERPQGASIKEMEEALGCERSTVYRYFSALEDCGYAPYPDESGALLTPEKRWHLASTGKAPVLQLAKSELIALHFIRGFSRLYRGTTIEEDIDNVFGKLGASLSSKTAEHLKRVESLFVPTLKFAKDYSAPEVADVIDELTTAMLGRRRCRIRYDSFQAGEVKESEIGPLHFFEYNGGLYIFALFPKYGNVRMLAVERIRSIETGTETFEYPEGFDPEERLEGTFTLFEGQPIRARIRFDRESARYIRERSWAKEQSVVENPDGSIVLELATSGRDDILRWVMGFGDRAELLEPADLREEIRDTARRIAGLYACS
jgi:predicted DNA-binding transcriptional regulator YafY